MRSAPTVVITCDRCGHSEAVEHLPEVKMPTGWRSVWLSKDDDGGILSYELCPSCAKAYEYLVAEWIEQS